MDEDNWSKYNNLCRKLDIDYPNIIFESKLLGGEVPCCFGLDENHSDLNNAIILIYSIFPQAIIVKQNEPSVASFYSITSQ